MAKISRARPLPVALFTQSNGTFLRMLKGKAAWRKALALDVCCAHFIGRRLVAIPLGLTAAEGAGGKISLGDITIG